MKRILGRLFLWYLQYFPIQRGKQFLAIFLSKHFGSFLMKSKSGFWLDIYLKSSQDLYLISVKKDNQSDNILKLINDLKSGDTFIDIGANIGYYSLAAAEKVADEGMVYSFEPSFREYSRLLTGILINKVKNIVPFNIALCDSCGQQSFLIDLHHTGLNKLSHSKNEHLSSNIVVSTFTFDEIVRLQKIKKIDLMKIDVEGAEFLVLSGMKKTLSNKIIKQIVVEITPKFLIEFGHDKEELYNFLNSYGYKPIINSKEWQFDEIFVYS